MSRTVVSSNRQAKVQTAKPQPSPALSPPPASSYYVTRTGKHYHLDEDCRSLRVAKKVIPVCAVPAGLTLCPKCGGKGAAKAVKQEVVTKKNGKGFIVTKTGKYYHRDDECAYLRLARTREKIADVPKGLKACPKCMGKAEKVDKDGVGYVTKGGKRFHLERDCRYIAGKEVVTCEKGGDMLLCRACGGGGKASV